MPDPKRRLFHKLSTVRRPPPGASPGTLAANPGGQGPRITVIAYGPDDFFEVELPSPNEIAKHRDGWPVLWIDVDGLGDADVLRQVGAEFNVHQLALADVVNIPQRAKVEPYDEHLFVIARMVQVGDRLETEQVSMFVGEGWVLTFQERVGDSFDPVRERIRKAIGKIRRCGADYLAYALIDALIDGYYPVLEGYGDRIEELEEEVLADPDTDAGWRIHSIKRDLLTIRRSLIPHREALHVLLRRESPFVREETTPYLRDCYDHVIQLTDLLETYRELSAGLLDVHLATVNNRMNEVMKVLTVFAALFIPLSFIAGVYGMNFSQDSPWNMPELRWAFGYPALLVVMGVVAAGLLAFFRRRGWIGGAPRTKRDSGRT